jgi:hypothetical protein
MFDIFNFAYLDPGTGSLIVQSLIGVVAGISVFGRNVIRQASLRAKKLFSRSTSKAETK